MVNLTHEDMTGRLLEHQTDLLALTHPIDVVLIDHQHRLPLVRIANLTEQVGRSLGQQGGPQVFGIQGRAAPGGQVELGIPTRRPDDGGCDDGPSHRGLDPQLLGVAQVLAELLLDR